MGYARATDHPETGEPVSEIAELKRELEAAREAIEALDDALAAGRLGPEEHARQCADRERAAGRLFVMLRRAQRHNHRESRADAPMPPAAPTRARGPALVVAVAILLVLAGVGAGLLVAPRRPTSATRAALPVAPSASPTGDAAAAMNAAELLELRRTAARDDAPTATLLQFAHVMLDQGDLAEARRMYDRVLAREPRNPEAITHLGALLYREGHVDQALAKVDEALRTDPRYVHALWDRAEYLFHGKQDYAAAVQAAEAFLTVVPSGPDAETIKRLMAEARQQTGLGKLGRSAR
jgi:tetratricopeptide (TPR) repeat protein